MSKLVSTCEECSDEFKHYPSQGKGRFCSQECANEYQRDSTKKVTSPCKYCDEPFEHYTSETASKTYCSQKCSSLDQRKYERKVATCLNCDEEFEYVPQFTAGKFCDSNCAIEYQSADGHDESGVKLKDANWSEFSVYKEDYDACELCEHEPDMLQVHHLEAVNDGGDVTDESNLLVLCGRCHTAIDPNYTAEDLGEMERDWRKSLL